MAVAAMIRVTQPHSALLAEGDRLLGNGVGQRQDFGVLKEALQGLPFPFDQAVIPQRLNVAHDGHRPLSNA